PFKGLRLTLSEILQWFKGLNVDSIELWIEGASKKGNHTELFLSLEGRTGAKITLKPTAKTDPAATSPVKVDDPSVSDATEHTSDEPVSSSTKLALTEESSSTQTITALFSPSGGV